jgi:transcriptional regulator with XRE-family HTH domain
MAAAKKSSSTDLVARGRKAAFGGLSSGIGTALSMMKTASDFAANAGTALKVAQTIGSTIKATREVQQLSIGDLAKRAGVSKSVVSRIEQGLTSPTAVMLAKLAEGMTVSLSSLLRGEFGPPVHIQTLAEQPIFKDPKTGLVRRTLSPVSPDATMEIVHNTLPAKKTTGSFPAHSVGTQEHIVVLAGKIEVTVGRRNLVLNAGDAAQFVADIEHSIKNVGAKKAEWILTIHSPPRATHRSR